MTTRIALVRFVDRHEGILSASDLLTLDPLIDAIEAEAVAAERVRLAEAVRALPKIVMAYPEDDPVYRWAVLALLEDKAEPTHSEIGGPDGHGNVILERLSKP